MTRKRGKKNVIGLLKREIWERDNYTCFYCLTNMQESYERWRAGNAKRMHVRGLTVDHVIPRSKGGPFSKENLITSCYACNNARGNRPFEEYLAELRQTQPLF